MNRLTKILALFLFAFIPTISMLAQETLTYQQAQYPDGMRELNKIIFENVRPDGRLLSYMKKEGISEVTATFALVINTKGKLVAIDVLETSDPNFDEKYFAGLIKRFKKETFIPGTINGKPAVTNIIFREFKHGILSTTTYTKEKENRRSIKVIR